MLIIGFKNQKVKKSEVKSIIDFKQQKLAKIVIMLIIFTLTFAYFSMDKVKAATTVEPNENQYLELRAVSFKEVEGKDKQLIFELWGHNIQFKGFDVRFSLDSNKFKTSNINGNDYSEDETQFFQFENEFISTLDMFTLPLDENVFRMIVSVEAPTQDTQHIINNTVTTGEDLLIAKLSLRTTAQELNINDFGLVQDVTSPKTGIKINIDGDNAYENPSTFKFIDKTFSKDAFLQNMIVSSGQINEEKPDESNYQEYALTPNFTQETYTYETKLMEYRDTIDITAILNDEKASMKIRLAKRDETTGEVVKNDVGEITYVETQLPNNTKLTIPLNKLGQPDTIVTIIVTAEDGVTTKQYQVTIKRPYATIKGKNILADFDDTDLVQSREELYGVEITNQVDINLYKPEIANWESITDIYGVNFEDPLTYEQLETIPKIANYQTNKDGTFEIYVIPGSYDIQFTRLAYLDYIFSDYVLQEGETIDLGTFRMEAGDINRDGLITSEDLTIVKNAMSKTIADVDFSSAWNPSQSNEIVTEDLVYAKSNVDKELKIVYFATQ